MFGRNQVFSPTYRDDGRLLVKEIFYTIQGEGPRAGQPAVFVRLAGCNLRCYFCDTDFEGGEDLSVAEIVERVRAAGTCNLVVLTGGEPFAQQVLPLVHELWRRYQVTTQVETAGTVVPPDMQDLYLREMIHRGALEVVCSPKTPKLHPEIEACCWIFKYIVRNGEIDSSDGLPRFSTQIRGKIARLYRPKKAYDLVYLQPMDEQDTSQNKLNLDAAVRACMKFGYRLSIQQHKIAGVP